MVLERMIARHPKNINDVTSASRFIAELSQPASAQKATSASAVCNWSDEKKVQYTKNFLQNDLFPHIGIGEQFSREKAFALAHCIWMLLMKAVGFATYDSKDDFVYQRYDTNGVMHASFQRRCLTKFHTRVDLLLRNAIRDQTPFHW